MPTATKDNPLTLLTPYFEIHRNGSAKIAPESHISHDSFADHQSTITGRSIVSASSLIASQVSDAHLPGSQHIAHLPNSLQSPNPSKLVHSTVANSSVNHSKMVASVVLNTVVLRCNLENVIVTSLAGLKPYIEGVRLVNCVIEGNVRLIGPWELSGTARIHEGEWFRAPRFKTITHEETSIKATLTECVNGKALIACRCYDMRRWQRSGPRLGRMLGWPAELVREAWLTFEEWIDNPQ